MHCVSCVQTVLVLYQIVLDVCVCVCVVLSASRDSVGCVDLVRYVRALCLGFAGQRVVKGRSQPAYAAPPGRP